MPKIGLSQLAPALAWPKYFYQGFNRQYFRKVLSYRPIAYWPLWEASGAVAYDYSKNGNHGAYTGVTLGEIGIGDGRTCPYFDGANDYVNIFSAGLAALFDGAEVTVALWLKPNTAAVWDDGTIRTINIFYDDDDNQIYKSNDGSEQAGLITRAAGTWGGTLTSSAAFGALWQLWAITRSETDDEEKVYRYVQGAGGQVGATDTGIGAFAGAIVSAVVGALDDVPNRPWHGWLAHQMIFEGALSGTQIADLAVV